MARKTATFKQTAGGGFNFEDKVCAWFLSHLLTDKCAFDIALGKIQQVDFQVKPDGWLLDDLLINQQLGNGEYYNIAVSVKSNSQFNTKGVSKELISDLWSQYLNDSSDVFKKNKDYLCIINAPLGSDLSKNINALLASAKETDSSKLWSRINKSKDGAFSQIQKAIFNSFSCPAPLAKKYSVKKTDIGSLLSRVMLLEFDFELDTSRDANRLIEICKSSLQKEDNQIANSLYEKLCSLRGAIATKGGFLDYNKLVAKLRDQFELKGLSSHLHDWEKISRATKLKLSSISDKIGGKVGLQRKEDFEKITETVEGSEITFLLSKSGHGKSVLAKKCAEKYIANKSKVMWVDAQSFEYGNLSHRLELQHNLEDLIQKVQDPVSYLFIDGIDRFFKESQLTPLAELLTPILDWSKSCKIILTCQTEDYGDVLERLYRKNVPLNGVVYDVKKIGMSEFLEVQQQFPALSELFKHSHLREILSNLKYLDLLAYNITQISSPGINVSLGESDIIDWLWKVEIESGENTNGLQNSRFMQILAEKQADKLTIGIATSEFEVAELAPLSVLQVKKVISEREDRLYFNHDLFGDWARYKMIRANKDKFKSFILSKSLLSPLWCKAVRLYGVYLLENGKEANEWKIAFESFDKNNPSEQIVQDLLLEATIFSASPLKHLESTWELLKANSGQILRRFLNRFLLKATLPNSQILRIAREIPGWTLAEASAYDRIPNYFYWPPVIEFIHIHETEMIEMASKNVSLITSTWLKKTPNTFVSRIEAAEIALSNAEWIFDMKLQGSIVKDDLDKEAYKAFLAGTEELPDKVIALALKLCRRLHFEKKEKNEPRDHAFSISRHFKIRDAIQWPDGPYERIDGNFEDVCLETDALYPLITLQPIRGTEILLALFIEPPTEVSDYSSHHYKLDINEPHQWFPPFYNRGPVLFFLRVHPQEALDFIIKLVNFATEQWINTFQRRQKFKDESSYTPQISVNYPDKSRTYIGDQSVYFWYRDVGNAPHSLVSILMALEKFLIDCVDENKNISSYVTLLLEKGNSVAFLGILNSIGKYKRELYGAILQPLLSVYEFYLWERMLRFGGSNVEGHQMIGSNFYNQTTRRLAKEWNELPQRKQSLQDIAISLILSGHTFTDFFNEVISKWKIRLSEIEQAGEIDPYLSNLISQFDKKNYLYETQEDKIIVTYNEPVEISDKLKDFRQSTTESSDHTFFPTNCKYDLEHNTEYTLAQIESVWVKIRNMEKLDFPDPYHYLSPKYQYIFGGIAILIAHNRIWGETHPEYLDWIKVYTGKILDEYSVELDELNTTDIGTTWGAFAARFIPELWVTDPSDRLFRKMVGTMVLKSSYDVQHLLFSNISIYLKWSDQKFVQVQNLLIRWSSYIYNYRFGPDENTDVINSQADKLLEEFIAGKTPVSLFTLAQFRIKRPKRRRRTYSFPQDEQLYAKEPGIDTDMLLHAFSSLPRITLDAEDIEYQYRLNFWKQMVEQLTFQLGDIKEDSPEIEGYPEEFDRWILKEVSHLILYMKPVDNHEYYWKPILQYGSIAYHWVDNFSLYFMLITLDNEDRYDRFFVVWHQMLDFAYESVTWKRERKYPGHRDPWYALIGLPENHMDLWDGEYSKFIERASEQIKKWLAKGWFSQEVIARLMDMLRRKSAVSLAKNGIQLMNTHLLWQAELKKKDSPQGFVLRKFEHDESLARTASYLWENHKSLIKEDENVFAPFREIVLYLVSLQNPVGLELQDRIVQE